MRKRTRKREKRIGCAWMSGDGWRKDKMCRERERDDQVS
jgi:hypothetical protein